LGGNSLFVKIRKLKRLGKEMLGKNVGDKSNIGIVNSIMRDCLPFPAGRPRSCFLRNDDK